MPRRPRAKRSTFLAFSSEFQQVCGHRLEVPEDTEVHGADRIIHGTVIAGEPFHISAGRPDMRPIVGSHNNLVIATKHSTVSMLYIRLYKQVHLWPRTPPALGILLPTPHCISQSTLKHLKAQEPRRAHQDLGEEHGLPISLPITETGTSAALFRAISCYSRHVPRLRKLRSCPKTRRYRPRRRRNRSHGPSECLRACRRLNTSCKHLLALGRSPGTPKFAFGGPKSGRKRCLRGYFQALSPFTPQRLHGSLIQNARTAAKLT